MKKKDLIAKCVEAGLNAEGTMQQLRDRLEAWSKKPKPTVAAPVEESDARKAYRMSSHTPKVRKRPRNEQVASDE